ncbi:hypothetical protein R3P38DRAFT_3620829 [Favolaschia claudopus]|uniref:Uncharacterized protein n=1 Tax=Favolaschia claudopus TaxID=2862362 RepID=A0AAW0DDP1_9AGAR
MTTHTAIVDDRDPAIAYSGSWEPGGVAEEFQGTTTAPTGQAAASAAFSFVGTSVTVYGTIAAHNLTTQPTLTFTVDGSPLGSFTPVNGLSAPVHHQALWTSPSLSLNDGPHDLVIEQTSLVSDTVIFMDYITFTTTSASVSAYFVDDRDTRVQYNPAWEPSGSEHDFQHTSQASRGKGDSLTLQFDGQSISFYGGFISATANASISIDGGRPMFWVPPTSASWTNNLIFDSGYLTPGTHKLVVTAMNNQPVSADDFLITPNPPTPSSSSSAPSTSASPLGSNSQAGSLPSSSESSLGSSSSFSPSSSSIGLTSAARSNSANTAPIGMIVGVVVGIGLPLILGLSLFVYRWRKRRVEARGQAQTSDIAQSRASSLALPSVQGQERGGMIPSNKLTREIMRAGQWVATAPSASTSAGAKGQQPRESRGGCRREIASGQRVGVHDFRVSLRSKYPPGSKAVRVPVYDVPDILIPHR